MLNKHFLTLGAVFLSYTLGYSYQPLESTKFYSKKPQKVTTSPRYILGDLVMRDKIIITGEMIEAHKDQSFPLGTFCAYMQNIKNTKQRFPLRVSSNQGKFKARGINNQGDLAYRIYVNKQPISYGKVNYIRVNNRASDSCHVFENITITFSGNTIRNAKAGNYALTLNFFSQ
ncbi:hypothetical protein [Fangia hongkongensis]|uniref:hypothetical protein n=1 Tax=Fangia hongkongensis TaxID=270495 RepID=UPI00036A37E1|nr:hypothetical protein [Fangia hongkongensis]MBK2123631.1 hypothetical protein [Fangia hongkongensis]